jgi:hypothetical protein
LDGYFQSNMEPRGCRTPGCRPGLNLPMKDGAARDLPAAKAVTLAAVLLWFLLRLLVPEGRRRL